jgi:hypothetical protein
MFRTLFRWDSRALPVNNLLTFISLEERPRGFVVNSRSKSAWIFILEFILVFENRVARWFVFKQKITLWEKIFRGSDWKMLIYFMAIWSILGTFGIFYDHLVHCAFIWYSFFRFWYHTQRKIWQPCPKISFWDSFCCLFTHEKTFRPGLPDFSCFNVPKS